MRSAKFMDFQNIRLYLEYTAGLNPDQVDAIYDTMFYLGRITFILGFVFGVCVWAVYAWVVYSGVIR